MNETLQSAFREAFAAHASSVFLEEQDGRIWRYGDMADASMGYANALTALCVEPGQRVLVQVDKSPFSLAVYFACVRIGAVFVPINIDYTETEIAYFLDDSEPTLAICRPAAEAIFARLASTRTWLSVRTLDADGRGSLRSAPFDQPSNTVQRSKSDIAAILYTSGTTGRPKGAMMSHLNLLANARTLIEAWRFTHTDRLIHALPIFHTHGLFVAVHCVLLSGARMLFLPRFDADAVLAAMPGSTVLMGVPTFYTRLLALNGLTKETAREMRLFISGSAPLSADTFRAFEARTAKRVLERYGMTETGMLTSNPYDAARIAGSVGPPLPGVALRVTDPDSGKALAPGMIGIVEVRGANVFTGYWRRPVETKAEFRTDGFFITGDMGLVDENGYVHLVGRAKDLIISGGLNVYPKEVEAALDDRPEIAESAVIGIPHPDLGEAVVAIVALNPEATCDEVGIRHEMRTTLAAFKVPKRVIVSEALPRNAMGKIQKAELRRQYADLFAAPPMAEPKS